MQAIVPRQFLKEQEGFENCKNIFRWIEGETNINLTLRAVCKTMLGQCEIPKHKENRHVSATSKSITKERIKIYESMKKKEKVIRV